MFSSSIILKFVILFNPSHSSTSYESGEYGIPRRLATQHHWKDLTILAMVKDSWLSLLQVVHRDVDDNISNFMMMTLLERNIDVGEFLINRSQMIRYFISVTNISKLSPTHFVHIIFHQHGCSRWNIDRSRLMTLWIAFVILYNMVHGLVKSQWPIFFAETITCNITFSFRKSLSQWEWGQSGFVQHEFRYVNYVEGDWGVWDIDEWWSETVPSRASGTGFRNDVPKIWSPDSGR